MPGYPEQRPPEQEPPPVKTWRVFASAQVGAGTALQLTAAQGSGLQLPLLQPKGHAVSAYAPE